VIFLDTGAFFARFYVRDQYHDQSLHTWDWISEHKIKCYTSNFIINEILVLLRPVGLRFALDKARSIYSSGNIEILRPSQNDEAFALEFFKQYGEQKVSFTDCVSFALMKRSHLKKAFTFDDHFQMAGFQMVNSPE
jgi:hypothetical protein